MYISSMQNIQMTAREYCINMNMVTASFCRNVTKRVS